MARCLLVCLLFVVTPVSAQWSIEESRETDVLRSRPTATAAGLVGEEGWLAWEYMCIRIGSGYTETLDLYTERSGEQFSGGTVRYRFDSGQWQRVRWNSFGASLGFHSDDEMHRFLGMLRRYRSLVIQVATNRGNLTGTFDLAGTAAMLDEIACPVEAALAHVVQNRVEAAYRRTDLFERRRRLMGDWAAYLSRGPTADH